MSFLEKLVEKDYSWLSLEKSENINFIFIFYKYSLI